MILMICFNWIDTKRDKPTDGEWVYIMVDSKGSYSPNKELNECDVGIGMYSSANDQWYRIGFLDGKGGRMIYASSKADVIYWSRQL